MARVDAVGGASWAGGFCRWELLPPLCSSQDAERRLKCFKWKTNKQHFSESGFVKAAPTERSKTQTKAEGDDSEVNTKLRVLIKGNHALVKIALQTE